MLLAQILHERFLTPGHPAAQTLRSQLAHRPDQQPLDLFETAILIRLRQIQHRFKPLQQLLIAFQPARQGLCTTPGFFVFCRCHPKLISDL